MEPNKRNIIIGAVIAVIVVVGLAWWGFGSDTSPLSSLLKTGGGGKATVAEPTYNGVPVKDLYNPTIPKNAVVSESKAVAPAGPDPILTNKSRTYDLKATKSGFSPNSLTVGEFDTVQLDFTAVDNNYSLTIPYLGINFAATAKGETKRLVFTPTLSGTFTIEAGSIKGSLIIIPYKK
ncbi:MAG: hypothetical protein AAB377_00740 [Patescibacteria group bacterium]